MMEHMLVAEIEQKTRLPWRMKSSVIQIDYGMPVKIKSESSKFRIK
tara:strand:- start:1 stop:138 length:138 start_codon:yes stop_codon:yes gene_type:complete